MQLKILLLSAFLSSLLPLLSFANPCNQLLEKLPETRKISIGVRNHVGEKYQLEQSLGVGGQAKVVRGTMPKNSGLICDFCKPGESIAVKIADPRDLVAFEALKNEFIVSQKIAENDPKGLFIRTALDVETGVLIMAHDPRSMNLLQFLKKLAIQLNRIQTDYINRQLDEALRILKISKLVHSDLKPQNILITPELKIRIIDFGISAPIGGWAPYLVDRRSYTLPYSSPNQIENGRARFTDDSHAVKIIKARIKAHPYKYEN